VPSAPTTDRPPERAFRRRAGESSLPPSWPEPFPDACLPRAGALGLERVEATLASQAVAASVAEFVERYALGASPAVHDLARDGVARVSVAADETTVPPEVAAVFAETVSLVRAAPVRELRGPALRSAGRTSGGATRGASRRR